MPNDAKLGMACGVALVFVVAIIFFGRELPRSSASADVAANRVQAAPRGTPRNLLRHGKGETANGARTHTVKKGETLFAIAQQYYRDGDRCIDLYVANRDVVKSPEGLEPGTVLVIPQPTGEKVSDTRATD